MHKFGLCLVSQLEDKEEEKPRSYKVRNNKNLETNKLKIWEDAFTNDYIHCSEDLEEYFYYEWTTDFEKNYNTYKEVDEMFTTKNEGRQDKYKTKVMDEGDPRKGYSL